MVFKRSLLVWLAILAAESAHGVARTLLLEPRLGDFRARQVAVFTGSLLILAIVTLLIRWLRPESVRQALGVGALWVALTVAFEILLGRSLGFSWDRLASDYNLLEGGLLPLGMLVLMLSPLMAAKIRGVNLAAERPLGPPASRRPSGTPYRVLSSRTVSY